MGEAERCLARGFRLMRNDSYLALRLAEIYQRTDRPRDALAVLDLCLREGSEDPNVAWEASMTAFRTESYEPLLTYLDRYEHLQPDQPWANYFRAIAQLELGKPRDALESLTQEERRSPERPFGIEALRACAFAALGQLEPLQTPSRPRPVDQVVQRRLFHARRTHEPGNPPLEGARLPAGRRRASDAIAHSACCKRACSG